MSVRQYQRRVIQLEQRQPAATTPTLVFLDGDQQLALVGGVWVSWNRPLPSGCKVYGFDPRTPAEESPV